jgi:Homeodomain-like domain
MKKQGKKAPPNRKKILVSLTTEEVGTLEHIVRSGTTNARVITRARILLCSQRGMTNRRMIETLGCSHEQIRAVRHRACERTTIEDAIHDLSRPGQPKKITPQHEAFVIATACTDAPEGHNHWTLPELKRVLLKRYKSLSSVSDERIRHILMASDLKPWREKNVVHSQSHPTLS